MKKNIGTIVNQNIFWSKDASEKIEEGGVIDSVLPIYEKDETMFYFSIEINHNNTEEEVFTLLDKDKNPLSSCTVTELDQETLLDEELCSTEESLNKEGKALVSRCQKDEFSTFYISSISTLPEKQRKGYGTLLLRAVLKTLKERDTSSGVVILNASTLSKNEKSISATKLMSFYKKNGFSPIEDASPDSDYGVLMSAPTKNKVLEQRKSKKQTKNKPVF